MLRWCVACGALLLAVACDRQEQLNREMRENLTTGYWQAGTDDSQLVRFTTSGEVFYFRCAPVAAVRRSMPVIMRQPSPTPAMRWIS